MNRVTVTPRFQIVVEVPTRFLPDDTGFEHRIEFFTFFTTDVKDAVMQLDKFYRDGVARMLGDEL